MTEPTSPEPPEPPEPAPPPRPGASIFTIEGRAAPGLFVVGWLASLLGLGVALVALMAGGGVAGTILFLVGLALLSVGLVAAAGAQSIERRARGRTDYVGPSPVLGFLVSVPLTILAGFVVIVPLVRLGLDPEGPLATLLSVLATAVVYVAVIRLLVVGTGALSWRDMGLRRPSQGAARELAWGAVLAIPVLFVTGLLGLLLVQLFQQVPPNVLPPAPDLTSLAFNLAAAAVVAPVGEELFFRGYVTTAWARTDDARAAIVRGAILFAGAHILTVTATTAGEGLAFATYAFLVRLPVAVVLGWLYLRTRSLYGPIALHATFNALPVLASAGLAE